MRLKKILTIFFVPFLLILIARVIVPWFGAMQSTAVPKAVATPKPINVLEIRYYPSNRNVQEAQTQALSDGLVAAMSDASMFHAYKDGAATKYSQVVIKRSIERDTMSPTTTGSYPTWYLSMNTMLTADGEDLCDYIVANNIDQVWFWKDVQNTGGDTGGFNLEYARFWNTNTMPVQSYPPLCGGRRTFLVLGLDQNRAVSEALHSFGHSMEDMIPTLQSYDLFWTRWSGSTGALALANVCGNVHFPPNGTVGAGLGYDYANSTSVTTSCENWLPDGTGTTTSISCTRWGCDELGYLKWWFQNMPNESNGLMYSGKELPNWWDFVSDTDTAITTAVTAGKFMSEDFTDIARPSYVDYVSKAGQANGSTLTLSHTVSGSNRLLVVGASYRSPSKSTTISGNEQITAVTIGATPLTRVTRTIFHEYVTELWYVIAPPTGTNTITVTFASGVQDEAVAGTSFIGVDQSTPFDTVTGYQAGTAANSLTPTITVSSTSSQVVMGVVSMYTGNNSLTSTGSTQSIWGMHTTNVISKGGVVTGAANSTLSWSATTAWPWSISAVAINIIQATPSPSPTSTPDPTAIPTPVTQSSAGPVCNSQCNTNSQCPSDLICDYGRCRRPGCTAVDTCTCGPSCNSSCSRNSDCPSDLICDYGKCRRPGCTAVDSCSCGTPAPQVVSTSTPVSLRTQRASTVFSGKLLVNGRDSANYPNRPATHLIVPIGSRPILSWSTNSLGCTASGGWIGKKSAKGSERVTAVTVKTLYRLLCTMPDGKVYPLTGAVYLQ